MSRLWFKWMEWADARRRARAALGEYMRNGWVSPWRHKTTWREKWLGAFFSGARAADRGRFPD